MIDISSIYEFSLVLVRMTAYFVTAPVFSSKTIPARFKIGFAFFVSLVIFPTLTIDLELELNGAYVFYIIQETILGIAIGLVAQIIFSSIQIAGSFIDMQIGFSLANVIDPQTGAQSPIMGNFKYAFAILLLFTLNIHYLIIDGIIASYETLPITGNWFSKLNDEQIFMFIMSTFSKMFVIAFKISAPIVVTLLITDIVLGILARTFPQLNIFVIGVPLKILITFIILLALTSIFINNFKDMFYEMINTIKQFIDLMGL